MNRLRVVLGFMVSAIMIASSFAHSLLGWKRLSAELARAQVPPDLISRLGIGWYWGGESMFTLGFVVFFVFVQFVRNPSTSLQPAQIIAFFYAGFGVMAIKVSHNPFFLIFVIPGLLLLVASWRSTSKVSKESAARTSS